MALIRRGESNAQPARRAEVDPFRLIDQMLRWEPFRGADPFRAMAPLAAEERAFVPRFEVKETKEGFLFKADLPGVKENDLHINLTGTLLTISGKRDEEHKEEAATWYAYERNFGSFSRSFTLPESADIEHVTADLKEGVLTLVLPKKPELQPRKINVNVAKSAEKH